MQRTTKKLSGPALDRYLTRFFAKEPGLAAEMAARLALRGRITFSSVRVRKIPLASPAPRTDAATAAPNPVIPTPPKPVAAPPSTAPSADAGFDAYGIGLVPTFQREGHSGLVARLAAVSSAENLRKMARAQQIVLPEAMRQGDVTVEVLRTAIADAVAKRIADRKAAAGQGI